MALYKGVYEKPPLESLPFFDIPPLHLSLAKVWFCHCLIQKDNLKANEMALYKGVYEKPPLESLPIFWYPSPSPLPCESLVLSLFDPKR